MCRPGVTGSPPGPIRLAITDPERAQDERDSTTFQAAAQTLREMVELGDHLGITPGTVFHLVPDV